MSFDGTDFQRLHLDETHGEDRPYDAGFLRQSRSNAIFLNRERGHDCSITWAGSTAGSNVRAEKIRPWCWKAAPENASRPACMSIWRTWVLAGQGIKTIELDIWYRVSDAASDPDAVRGTGAGASGSNQTDTAVDARLATPGALQTGGEAAVTTLTPQRDANGEELWQRATLTATIAPDYAASIDHFAQILAALEVQSTPINTSVGSAGVTASSFPSRVDTDDAAFFTASPHNHDPLGPSNPWTMYVAASGHAPANLVAYAGGSQGADTDSAEVDSYDWTDVNAGETVDLKPLSYLQLRAGALRTTYYDLGSQYSGVNITEPDTYAERDPSGGVPRKIAQNLNQARRRPEPLCIGTQASPFGDDPNLDDNNSWGEGASHDFPMMHGYHVAARQSAYIGGHTDIYTTLYDERGVAPRHVTYAKFEAMGLAFLSSFLNDPDSGWKESDAGIVADVTFRATVYEIAGAGPSQVGQTTATVTDTPVYLTNGASKAQLLQQLHFLFLPSGGTSTNEPNLTFKEGQMDTSAGDPSDLPSGSPVNDYMTPDLWCDISGRDPDLPLRFQLECKIDSMTPGYVVNDFESVFSSNLNGIVSTAFSVWGFDL